MGGSQKLARPRVTRTPPTEHDVLEWIPDAVVVTDDNGMIVFANRGAERETGYRREELLGRHVEMLVPTKVRGRHARHRRAYQAKTDGVRAMGTTGHDFKVRRKDGTEFSADISLGPLLSRGDRQTIAVIRDITERRQLEDQLEHRALHDPLTDLANRTLFFDRLSQAVQGARRDGRQVALVMLDLDGFKAVNDAYGHAAGDEVLREIASRLRSGVRASDTAARIGGDEFAWILPRIGGSAAAARMVRRHLEAVQRPLRVKNANVDVGVSAGIAVYPDDGRDVDTLMRNADSAMYSAKREGRGIVLYMSGRKRR